ncbi:MFS transporter [Brachybacterium ginsengisoli]|uniref:MFS transporter n=1 Tax=Brachybacterium ginsengisoli TaxID=1331682 RepID=A0A291H025_9MICO|nr:MFS transporter [Brachybacterium ginsengisoli]ATG55742.1 MFS transporter [Brachybacterium ginsengisoli]
MTSSSGVIDDAPLTSFHKKLTAYSSGGPLIDGYAIAMIGFTYASMGTAFEVSAADKGLIAAAALVGIFVGGALFGWVTDKVGRHAMYIIDLLALALFSVLTFWAGDVWQIVLLRFAIGVAIGADYPIATSLLAEYLPRRHRGKMLGATFVVWAVGATLAPIVAIACTAAFGDEAWRWMLASTAVFAIITLLFRLGTPESPRWLLSKGRVQEADAAIRKVYGPGYSSADLGHEESAGSVSLGTLFRAPYRGRLIFVCLFWMCQVIPMLSIYSFSFDVLATVGLEGNGAEVFLAALFVLGGIPGLLLVDRIGRKALLVYSFAGIAVIWGMAGLVPGLPMMAIFVAICLFAFLSGSSNFLEVVVPNELFPTQVRATAVGIGTAASRIGAAIAVYLMPLLLAHGIAYVLLAGAAVSVVGLIVTLVWGEETAGRALHETSDGAESSAPATASARPRLTSTEPTL